MMRTLTLTCLALSSLNMLAERATALDDPVVVAQRCAAHVRHIVERCENAAADDTHHCLQTIRELLAAGRRDAAVAVGRECIRHSRERTRNCIAEVRDTCLRCIDYLLLLGADDLAGRLRNVCAEAIDHLESIQQRVENAIENALNGP